MQARRRRPPPPWERRIPDRRHPIGNATRRWPRVYDGGGPARPRINARYRRAFDGGNHGSSRRRVPSQFEWLKENPVRNGLIGLAIAGVAAPIGVNRYQQALRTDAAHERVLMQAAAQQEVDDGVIAETWATLDAEEATRDQVIEAMLEQHRDYRLTREMAEDIYDSAIDAEVDPEVAFGLVRAESSFRNTATSPVGAIGLTQLMPRTAAWMEPGVTTTQLRDQKTNLRVGFKYLHYLVNKYEGDTRLALLAYNRGPGTVDRALKKGQNPDNGYADFVAGKTDHGHQLYTSR